MKLDENCVEALRPGLRDNLMGKNSHELNSRFRRQLILN